MKGEENPLREFVSNHLVWKMNATTDTELNNRDDPLDNHNRFASIKTDNK